jgi:hypothetical protein
MRPAARILIAAIAVLSCVSLALAAAKQLDQTRTVIGHVLSAQDDPIAGAVVHLKNTRTQTETSNISGADGGFRFPGLAQNTDYQIYAEFKGARSDTKTISLLDPRKQVEIKLRIPAAK